jgi:hypothetical protein
VPRSRNLDLHIRSHLQLHGAVFRNEELRDLCSSPSIISVIKSRMMRWAGHVARMGKKRNAYRLLMGMTAKEATRKTKT